MCMYNTRVHGHVFFSLTNLSFINPIYRALVTEPKMSRGKSVFLPTRAQLKLEWSCAEGYDAMLMHGAMVGSTGTCPMRRAIIEIC